jgi:hypothetical protein
MIFVTVFTTILLGGPKHFFRSAQDLSVEEFLKNRSLAAAIIVPAIGLFIIFSNLYRYYYSYIDRDFALYGICFGSCGIFYGFYKWFRIATAKKSNDGDVKKRKKRKAD